ncbi:MAG TPA: response regulator [Thermoanaerobaculia bacterium]|nr:response regulator [Thermoanaerobaculia bacterium]
MSVVLGKRNLSPELLHDLRTPLNQIIGYSEMLVEESPEREGLVSDLQKIRSAGRRMLDIIDENFKAGSERRTTTRLNHDEISPPPMTREQPSIEPGVVLVVDDEESNRDVLHRRLMRQGHTVETASSGAEALRVMGETAFDVVLLDIMMPEMDGHEVLRRIKATDDMQHIAVIMISAVNEVESVVRCIEAGAEDYLTKPFDPTLLKARVDSCLQRKRGRDREMVLFAQLQQNFKRLQEVEKLRDDMRNMIVHDLRTPLTSVIAGIEMFDKFGALNAEQQEMMTIALSGGNTLLGMINDLLDVEKMEAGRTQLHYDEVSASALVAGAIAQVASLATEAHTVIVTEIAPDLPRFPADEKKLSRTLVNLIANAVKFTGAGTVTITASAGHDHVRFAVRDTGRGIPAEAFERIFEKFGQLDSRNKAGTGLGLAFCKLAVEAHSGHITVESTPGAGSTFAFTIPRTAPTVS